MYIIALMPWAMSEPFQHERVVDLGNNWKAVRRWEIQKVDGKDKLVQTQVIEYIYTHKQLSYPDDTGLTMTEREVKQRLGVAVPVRTTLSGDFDNAAAESTLRL